MSDPAAQPRPVSLVTIAFIFALLGLFVWVVTRVYHPAATAPQNQTAENFPVEDAKTKKPSDLAWKATPAARKQALAALREKQAAQAGAYAWVDQKAGVVQLPVDRAMELVVEQYGPKK